MSSNENKSGRPKKEINPFNNIFRELVGTATQQEVADKIGVSRQNVGRWLSGDNSSMANKSPVCAKYERLRDYYSNLSNRSVNP